MFATILLLSLIEVTLNQAVYEREQLQAEYPGFGDKFIIFPGEDGQDIIGRFQNDQNSRINIAKEVNEETVYFTYYSRQNRTGVVVRTERELAEYIDNSKKIKFLTHGWLSSSKSGMALEITSAYLDQSDVNVVLMDWNSISANPIYPIPMLSTPKVADRFSGFLNYLVDDSGIDPADIHLIGHSLGAHISGFAARKVRKGRIGRITGLDPAGPGFSLPLVDFGLVEGGYLTRDDAMFVDIIHTCAGFLGMTIPEGHVDFYPNGGRPPQPGCDILKWIEACSHGKSWKYFADSITSEKRYLASRCPSMKLISEEDCQGEVIPMGESTPVHARGIYYGTIDWKKLLTV